MLAAARAGARTALLEKAVCLGGLATLGGVIVYLRGFANLGHDVPVYFCRDPRRPRTPDRGRLVADTQ